jgi:RNA polymerase sigma-70 factor (ECF subfamily)
MTLGMMDGTATPTALPQAPPELAVPARVQAGPPPSFDAIYESCFGYVWACLRRLGVWDRDLEDATHDVFIVVHRRLGDFDNTRPVKPWLAGIATRVASEFRRRAQHRREVVSDDLEAVESRDDAHAVAGDRQRRALLMAALEQLSEDRRVVVVLHDIEGHGMPEIAAALETSVNTLYSRLRKGREDLAAAVVALSAPRTAHEGGRP